MDRINGQAFIDLGGGKRGFRDENLPAGVEGTEVTALWTNMVQEEIIKVIEDAGLALDPTDWGQLLKALSRRNQSGYLNYAVAGGTANGLTAALTSAPIAIPDGFQVNLKIALTNTGPATFNLNGLGARTIISRGGAPLVAGDLIGIARLIAIGGYWVLDAVNTISIVRRIFTTSTAYVPSAGLLYADVEIVGGGGGGGGAFGSASPNVSAADGGGGAAYVKKTYTPVQIGASASIVIGAGGVPAAAGQYNGLQGGNSTFTPAGTGNTLVAGGGGGGQYGRTATFPTRGEGLGAGGGGSGGEINQQGCASGWALMFGGSSSYSAISGRGGHSHFGFGGQESQENFAGNAGQGFGSGGGGGAALTVSKPGGAGAAGVCIVTEYIRNY